MLHVRLRRNLKEDISVPDAPLPIELRDDDEPDPRTAHTAEKQLDCISFNAGSGERFCNLICALLDTVSNWRTRKLRKRAPKKAQSLSRWLFFAASHCRAVPI